MREKKRLYLNSYILDVSNANFLSPSKNMRTNFLPRNLTTGPPLSLPHIAPWMHKHACAPHIAPSPGGARMALVPHCDTNQGRWRAPLSCKHQSFLVLFKCLPSLFLPSLTLAQPLARFALHPRPLLHPINFSRLSLPSLKSK